MKIQRMEFPDFSRSADGIKELFRNLPTQAGHTALNFFKDSWRRQGFIDRRYERWPRRAKGNDGRAVLVKSGRLRRSLRLTVGRDYFEIGTDVPYAKAHNEGETIVQTVTPRQRRFFWAMHAKSRKLDKAEEAEMWRRMALSTTITIRMPKRQFMGKSEFLEKRIVYHVERGLQAALK